MAGGDVVTRFARIGRGSMALATELGGTPGVSDGLVVDRWTQQDGLSPDTVRAYIGEAHRFLAWLASSVCCANGVAIPMLLLPYVTDDHASGYAAWLASEISHETDLAPEALLAYGLRSAPRRKALHPRSIVQSLSLLHALWQYAHSDGQTAAAFPPGNPFTRPLNAKRRESKSAKDKRGKKRTDVQIDDHNARFLNPAAWSWVEKAQLILNDEPRWQGARAKRAHLVYALAYYLALRIHEIRLLDDNNLVPPAEPGRKWQIDVTGKGGSLHRMSVPPELHLAISRCCPSALEVRRHDQEIMPLVAPLEGQDGDADGRVSLSTLARIFKTVSKLAAGLAKDAGEVDAAQKLERATAHWCRHARISHLLNDGAPPRMVQKLARHANAQTTQVYDHSDPEDVDGPIEEATQKHRARLRELNR